MFISTAEPIRRVLNNCGIKVALKSFRTLGHIFAKPTERVPTDQKTHAACILYKTSICTRLKEHQRAVSNSVSHSSKSALADHACETSHNIV